MNQLPFRALAPILVMTLVFALLVLSLHSLMAEVGNDGAQKYSEDVVLLLTTDKLVYSSGDPIRISVTIKNTGKRTYYIQKHPGICINNLRGCFRIRVKDAESKLVTLTIWGSDSYFSKDLDVYWYLQQSRQLFEPGDFMGLEIPLNDLAADELKPGKYTVQAIYTEPDLRWYIETKKLSVATDKLKYEVWHGKIHSLPVEITIR